MTEEYELLKKYLDGRSVGWWKNKYLPKMSYNAVIHQLIGYTKTMSDDVRKAVNEFIESHMKINSNLIAGAKWQEIE